ncbi:MAG: [protein-PII] uridylyltransferase, partial [Planctomycetia bacterium]|nr:[protein-PII] uridylyltransferase [Planctomycetia bacterium]
MTPGTQPDTLLSRRAAAVAEARSRVGAQHAAGAPGIQTCALASDLTDAVVVAAWTDVVAEVAGSSGVFDRQVALVAHGGYGRREMAPYSDVDLMILHATPPRGAVADAARLLLQALYDAGLEVGQSVRTVAEACRLSADDATVFSSLCDARLLAGSAELLERLESGLRGIVRRAPRRCIDALVEARLEEAEKYGETTALLQPNVKRSPGGLRDIQLVRWLGRVGWGATSLDDLVHMGGISKHDAEGLRDAGEFLMRVRNDLHLAAGRCADDLTRDEQVRLAARRGITEQAGLLGVERFMRGYFGHTRRVAEVADTLVQRLRRRSTVGRWIAGLAGHRVAGLFRVGPADVAALPAAAAAMANRPALVVQLVELSMLYGLPIAAETWETVRSASGSWAAKAPEIDGETRARFLALFDRPAGLGAALRRLHEVGLLERIIPEFAHARHLLQFNNYHKYTVDEHCIVAVEKAVELANDGGWLGGVWRQVGRKRTVLLALLIHDLGKGFVEDHSEVGARIARDVAARFVLPDEEAQVIEFLVLRHLAMAHVAFRRDVGDPGIAVGFAREVGSPEVLRMFTVLTAADVAAVGPGTWTRWKSDLLGDLHFRTLGVLDGESPSVAAERHGRDLARLLGGLDPDDPVVSVARELPRSYLRDTAAERIVEELRQLVRLPGEGVVVSTRWQGDTSTLAITVGTRESVAPGIFHRVTGAITSQRLEILAADINTLAGGLVLDHFVVHDPDFVGEPPADRLAEIGAAIRAAVKADEPPAFARRWNPFAPLPRAVPELPARILFDNESSERTTILEVFAHDFVGLLYSIA